MIHLAGRASSRAIALAALFAMAVVVTTIPSASASFVPEEVRIDESTFANSTHGLARRQSGLPAGSSCSSSIQCAGSLLCVSGSCGCTGSDHVCSYSNYNCCYYSSTSSYSYYNGLSTWAIVLIVISIISFIVAIIRCIWWCNVRNKLQQAQTAQATVVVAGPPPPAPYPPPSYPPAQYGQAYAMSPLPAGTDPKQALMCSQAPPPMMQGSPSQATMVQSPDAAVLKPQSRELAAGLPPPAYNVPQPYGYPPQPGQQPYQPGMPSPGQNFYYNQGPVGHTGPYNPQGQPMYGQGPPGSPALQAQPGYWPGYGQQPASMPYGQPPVGGQSAQQPAGASALPGSPEPKQ